MTPLIRIVPCVVSLTLAACAPKYSATEIEAWVVDAKTGQPIPGVNVVAHWSLEFGIEGGSRRDLELMETVTDQDGRFHFPAWGPKPFPEGIPWNARLEDLDPEIIFFKSGYFSNTVYNERNGPPYSSAGPKVRRSLWHGKKIPMHKFEGEPASYAFNISGTLTGVSYARCEWKKMPRMIAALSREAAHFKALGIRHSLPTIAELTASQPQCGLSKESFQEGLK